VKRLFIGLFIVMVLLALVMAVAAVGSAMWGGLPFDGTLVVDDETVHFGSDGFGVLAAIACTLIATMVVVIVVPLALLLGLGLPALLAAGVLCLGLLVAGAAVVMLPSPLLIVGAVVWWAVRQNRKLPKAPPLSSSPPTPPSSSTPPSMTMTP
jgi:hypothetical protein